jgi:hypothetical protein
MNINRRISNAVIDLITLLAMIGCWVSTDMEEDNRETFRNGMDVANNFSWGTLHSVLSIIFCTLIIIHILQHWKLIKGIIFKNLYTKNIVPILTLITFIVTVVSFLLYLTGFTHSKGEFHGTIANIFLVTGCIHLVFNLKKFLALFRGTLIKEGTWLDNYVSGGYTSKIESVLSSLFPWKDQNNK